MVKPSSQNVNSPFEDEEEFLLACLDVKWRAAARRLRRLEREEGVVGLLASGNDTVDSAAKPVENRSAPIGTDRHGGQ
jgi:hypothetical protein